MSTFTDWLESERLERNWTKNELARKANVDSGMMSRIINGRRPGLKVCQGIARAFGIDTQDVLEKANQLQHQRPPEPIARDAIDDYDRRILDVLHGMGESFKSTVLKTIRAWRFYEEHRDRDDE